MVVFLFIPIQSATSSCSYILHTVLKFIKYMAGIWNWYSLRGLHVRITWFSLYGIHITWFSLYGNAADI